VFTGRLETAEEESSFIVWRGRAALLYDDNRGRYSHKAALFPAALCAGFDIWRITCKTQGCDLILCN